MRTALAILVLTAGCLEPEVQPCGDQICPIDARCVANTFCASPDAIDACVAHADGEPCTFGSSSGRCADGVCIAAVCGNTIVEPGEVCDDGNQRDLDGCSAHCDSTETCGNGIVDYLAGEQCDDGLPGQTGDGCSSICTVELGVWRDVTPDVTLVPRAGHAMTYDRTRSRVVVFGGTLGLGGTSDETLEYDGVGWTRRTPTTSPVSRVSAAMTYDRARHRSVLFGGSNIDGYLGDTWEWDGVDWIDRTPPVSPGRRGDAALAYDDDRHVVVLYGGTDGSTTMGDTWEWDGTTWTERTPATHPPATSAHVLAYDEANHVTMMYGGATNQTWTWNGTDWAFHPGSGAPIARAHCAASFDGTRVVLFGGETAGTYSDLTYAWNGSMWIDTTPPSAPPKTTQAGLARLPNGGLLLVGGFGNLGFSQDTWYFNGSTWQITRSSPELERFHHGFAYDPFRGRVAVYGGEGSAPLSAFHDLGTLDGDHWTLRASSNASGGPSSIACGEHGRCLAVSSPATLPTNQLVIYDEPLWHAGPAFNSVQPTKLVYDAEHHRYVGLSGGPAQAQTFVVDDVTEQLQTLAPMHQPDLWKYFALVEDPARHQILAYTADFNTAYLWAFDGTDWTKIEPAHLPIRIDAALAYDPSRAKVVMHGGTPLGFGLGSRDMFEWDGTDFTLVAPTIMGPTLRGAAMTYDPIHHRMLVFGGRVNNIAVSASLWSFTYESVTAAERCSGPVDLDDDGLAGCADPDCAARCSTCGDGVCEPVEDYAICAADCTAP